MQDISNKERIVVAFTQLLREKDFHTISVTNITKKAQISRTIFYKHFKNVNDLKNKSIKEVLDKITAIFNHNLLLDGQELLDMLTYLRDRKDIFQVWVAHFPDIDNIVNRYIKMLVLNSDIKNLSEVLYTGYQISEKYSFDIYINTIQTLIFNWLLQGCSETPEEMAAIIDKAVLI
ncbi:TetR/AcrR family transcriptional regulator [Streptococcus pluranimalium]|uniref:TetR/AcrR family transcriptional regulator n=1 Tax=Streptococcus pluranimalium TaxID=82348 RepID=UPI0039FBE47C